VIFQLGKLYFLRIAPKRSCDKRLLHMDILQGQCTLQQERQGIDRFAPESFPGLHL
jgi:hypothetical protein